jgi:hypothetical protein
MKCFSHTSVDALAVCAYCGRALCGQCVQPNNLRMTCSSRCSEALTRFETALVTIEQQSRRSAQASAFYCYLCAGLSAAAAVVAWFLLPSPFLILFTGGCALVLVVSGVWYGRAGKKAVA